MEIEKGDVFDPLEVSGLNAKDYQGKDITNLITVTSDIYTQNLGESTVTYSVTDFIGKTVTKTMKVIVKKGMQETTLGDLTTDSTQVVGTAEPNAIIIIKAGDKEIGSGTVGSDGKYNLKIPTQVAGTKVTVTATLNGKESSASTVVTQGIQLAVPVIEDYYTTDAYAKGTVTGEAKQVAVFVNGVQKEQQQSLIRTIRRTLLQQEQ